MADGTTKDIKDIKSGDRVMSYDFARSRLVPNMVVEAYIHPDNPGYLRINDQLEVTGNHRLWVNDAKWARADELKVGDSLLGQNNENVIVESIESVTQSGTVYNLHLAGSNHNYFADGILAHNGKQ